MNEDEKLIMAVEKELLFGKDYFQGFISKGIIDYESRILKNFKYIKRGLAEKDPSLKQPIAYSIILNKDLKKVFAYQRALKDKEYHEKRLQGKLSWGIGGHIEKIDIKVNQNPIYSSLLRELEEEIEMGDNSSSPKVLGYINDDSNDVGRVHFGILYVIETNSIIKPKSSELKTGGLKTIAELEHINLSPEYVVETWSKISLKPLKEYLK